MITSQQIREFAAAGAVAGALGLCGCGSGDDKATSTATAAPAPARTTPAATPTTVPAGLRGRWGRTMRTADWGPGGSGYPIGRWRVAVNAHGEASVFLPGQSAVDFTTQLVVKDRALTIESIPICPGQKGRYTWRATRAALTLHVVDDACKPRVALFGGSWTSR